MPTVEPNHEQCRHRVCVVCLEKATKPYGATKQFCTISPRLKELLAVHVFDQYLENENILPCAICVTCRIILRSRSNPDPSKWRPILRKCDHAQLVAKLELLTEDVKTSTVCTCDICHKAKLTGIVKKKVGRPSTSEKKIKPITLPRCSKCHGIRKRGTSHKCNDVQKYKHIEELLSPKSQEHVSSTFIRQKSKTEPSKSESMLLKTRGRPMSVSVKGIHKLESPKQKIPHKTLLDIQVKGNFSDRATMMIAHGFRQGGGDVEPTFERALINRGKELSDFFEPRVIPWCYREKREKGSDVILHVTKQAIFCKDVKGFVDYVCQKREVADAFFRPGIDGGKGFVKVCLNVIDKSLTSHVGSSRKKDKYKDSGVKKIFILAVVEDKCEMYENLREILQHLHLHISKEWCLAGDLKVCNIIVGIGSHTSKYPCTWCYATAPYVKRAKFRTLGEIKWWHTLYVKGGRKNAQKYFNCINEPLITGDDDDRIIDIIPPPQLHLKLGVCNTLLDKLHKRWDVAYTWAASKGIVHKNYHGGKMEGHACDRLLQRAPDLEEVLPEHLKKFARAMSRFDNVIKSCFGKELKPNFLIEIERFRTSYMSLGINVTPKVHAIFDHVGDFCARRNTGLSIYAEQASESLHYDFNHFWNHCKYPESHPKYSEKLCSCVVRYNGKHLHI